MPSARENILAKIKAALTHKTIVPFADVNTHEFVYEQPTQELDIAFAEKFTQLQGKFSYCSNSNELATQLNELCEAQQWNKVVCNELHLKQHLIKNNFEKISTEILLANCDAAITSCEALVARTGSLLLSNNTASGRTYSVYAPIHICIAYTNQLVYDLADAFDLIEKKYGKNPPSIISLATGPSRTADIEKTLVVGVHGPKEVYCFLVDE